MGQLIIRCGNTDNLVVERLIAPAAAPQLRWTRPPITQIVMDAQVVERRPTVADAANDAGIPFLVDPCTPLLQSEVDPDYGWSKLPFATAGATKPTDLDLDKLVELSVQFQLEHGATAVIAPYLYATGAVDPGFAASVRLLEKTAEYLDANHLRLPLVAVLCGQLQGLDRPSETGGAMEHFLRVAGGLEVRSASLCLSPLGSTKDNYPKMARLFRSARRALATSEIPLIAWRQGVYGPALVAAGFDGYETGIGTGEQTNIATYQQSRKPKKPDAKRGGGGGGGVYLEPLGRSVDSKVAAVLMGTPTMRAKVMCEDEGCCPSVASTLDDPRPHAVRSRARLLTELTDQPHARWRLQHLAQQATAAVTLTRQADRLLADECLTQRLGTPHYEAFAQVLGELVAAAGESRSA